MAVDNCEIRGGIFRIKSVLDMVAEAGDILRHERRFRKSKDAIPYVVSRIKKAGVEIKILAGVLDTAKSENPLLMGALSDFVERKGELRIAFHKTGVRNSLEAQLALERDNPSLHKLWIDNPDKVFFYQMPNLPTHHYMVIDNNDLVIEEPLYPLNRERWVLVRKDDPMLTPTWQTHFDYSVKDIKPLA